MWQMHYIIRVKFNQSYADEVFKIYERVAILVFYLLACPITYLIFLEYLSDNCLK